MRLKLFVCLAATLTLLATAASAGHNLSFSFTLANSSASAHSNTSASTNYGTAHPASGTTHIEGIDIAHVSGGNLSPAPNDEDNVGQVAVTARWKAFFCATDTLTIDGTWETDLSNPPTGVSNPVARIQFSLLGNTIDAWVTQSSSAHGNVDANHYDITVADFGDSACSSGSVSVNITTYGTVPGSSPTRYISQNPSSTGTYDVEIDYVDKSSGSHNDSDTFTIT